MKRLALLASIVVLATAAAILLGTGGSAQGSSTARFDVIFDDARGLIGGQLVKVAGAQAGTIDTVVVTGNLKARVEASIDSRFMPFHANATCAIRPQGLIAENYIDCDPGTANSPILRGAGGQPPTVPVQNTTEPVSLLDLFNMFNLPTRERFRVLVNELGIGTAGRGSDINDIIRRANPALGLARQAIGILARQKAQLATIVDATNTIAAEAAGHTGALQHFLGASAALATQTATHSGALQATIARLPGLLAAARPALAQLDTVAVDGTPLVSQLHAAVPALDQVQRDLPPFAAAARPALAALGRSLHRAIPALRAATPLVRTLNAYTARSLPGTELFARLASNLQRHGFVENFLSVAYSIATSLSRFDGTSHLLSILLVGAQNGQCGNYTTKPVPGCSAHYGQEPSYQASHAAAERRTRIASPRRLNSRGGRRPARHRRARPRTPNTPTATPALPAIPAPQSGIVGQTTQGIQSLVGYLLK